MLQVRLQGDPAEAVALLEALRVGGAEVEIGGTKDRGPYSHVYAVVRMPGYVAAPAPVQAEVARRSRAVDRRR